MVVQKLSWPRLTKTTLPLKHQRRTVHFDTHGLHRAALRCSYGASDVVSTTQLPSHGGFNKTFQFTLDNGRQLVARVPNPGVGPEPSLSTASEVATMSFANKRLGIPTPRVLDYRSTPENEVGSEYIIMEKARGVPLQSVWDQMPLNAKMAMVESLADLEGKFVSERFDSAGSLYYERDFEPDLTPAGSATPEEIVVGPSMELDFWRRERKSMRLDRGPWGTPVDYIKAIAMREKAYISAHTRHTAHGALRATGQTEPTARLQTLDDYIALAPYLLPTNDERLSAFCLWHPDLHGNNIFVSSSAERKDAYEITDVTDWQHAIIAPIFLQTKLPTFLRRVGPSDTSRRLVPPQPDRVNPLMNERERRELTGELALYTYYQRSASHNADAWNAVHSHPHLQQGQGAKSPVESADRETTGSAPAEEFEVAPRPRTSDIMRRFLF